MMNCANIAIHKYGSIFFFFTNNKGVVYYKDALIMEMSHRKKN